MRTCYLEVAQTLRSVVIETRRSRNLPQDTGRSAWVTDELKVGFIP